jgi:hypothetical protein
VTPDQALAELGIDRKAGEQGARRAYLRLLKVRKPEVDPEGFMRLREAYEYLKGAGWIWESEQGAEAVSAAPVRVAAAPVYEERESDGDGERERDDEGDGDGERDLDGPRPESTATATSVDRDLDGPRPTSTATASAGESDSEDGESDSEDGESGGEAAAEGGGEREWRRLAQQYFVEGEHAKAAVEMRKVLVWAAENVGGEDPPVRDCLRLMLLLHARGLLAEAARLQREFAAWLAATGREAKVLRGELAVLWSLGRELGALPMEFPDGVRAAVAQAAVGGDLARARPALASYRIQRRSSAVTAAGMLRRKAPLVAAAVADVLDPPEMPAPASSSYKGTTGSGSGSARGIWAILAVVMGLFRILMATGGSSSPTYYSPTIPNFTVPQLNPIPVFDWDGGGLGLPSRLEQLHTTAKVRAGMVADDAKVAFGPLSKLAESVGRSIDLYDCDAAQATMKLVRVEGKRVKANPSFGILSAEVTLLDMGVHDFCKELGGAVEVDATADAGKPGKGGKKAAADAGSGRGTNGP